MRAVEFRSFGDPSQLHLVDRPDPHAGESTAIVRVAAASVNPSDVKNVAGSMKQTTLPRIPGRDYSGVVLEGPADWIGVEVWGTGGDVGFTRDGTHAELIEVPVPSLVRKPAGLSHEQAAAVGVTFVTAWIGLIEYARLQRHETLAVIGAGGGVGRAAVQLAKSIGANVIPITRDSPPPEVAQADVVFDTVGGPMFEQALPLLAHRGRLIEISGGSGRRASFDLIDFYHNESQLLGVDSLKRSLIAASAILRELRQGFEAEVFQAPPVGRVLPLTEARQGYEMTASGHPGRVVLKP